MKKAIEFLRSKGVQVTDEGRVLSSLPDGINGICLTDELEEFTEELIDGNFYFYTIILDKIEKLEM